MRQIKRYPRDKSYDFGLGIGAMFGLRKKAGDFVSETQVIENEIAEQFLEPKGTERADWKDETPEGMSVVTFIIKTEIAGGYKEEKIHMIDQLKLEFKDYIRERGTGRIRVTDISTI